VFKYCRIVKLLLVLWLALDQWRLEQLKPLLVKSIINYIKLQHSLYSSHSNDP
jgi:hypothetical protein